MKRCAQCHGKLGLGVRSGTTSSTPTHARRNPRGRDGSVREELAAGPLTDTQSPAQYKGAPTRRTDGWGHLLLRLLTLKPRPPSRGFLVLAHRQERDHWP
jgi:hypothetical protein